MVELRTGSMVLMVRTMDKFTKGYIDCALWVNTDGNDRPLDRTYTVQNLSPEALASITADCEAFQRDNANDLSHMASDSAGNDFFLTRNRHGGGFWDRGLGEVGKRLTEAAHVYGESNLYVGDDGLLYVA